MTGYLVLGGVTLIVVVLACILAILDARAKDL